MHVKYLYDRLVETARRERFKPEIYGKVGDIPLPAFTRISLEENAPHVYISTGVHGDEPAGPLSVLELFKRRCLPSSISFTIIPLINPTGLAAKTRGNDKGTDLNRDYGINPLSYETRQQIVWLGKAQFDLAICLHEDYEGEGFYLYELIKAETMASNSEEILKAAEPFVGIDPREIIDEMPAKKGLMFPPKEKHTVDRPDMPEALWLAYFHTGLCYTTETPSGFPIADRVEAQLAAVKQMISLVAKT